MFPKVELKNEKMEAGREKLGKIREFVQKVQHLNKKSLGKRKEGEEREGNYKGNNSRKFPRNKESEIPD